MKQIFDHLAASFPNLYKNKVGFGYIDTSSQIEDHFHLAISKNIYDYWAHYIMSSMDTSPVINENVDELLQQAFDLDYKYLVVGALGVTYKDHGLEFMEVIDKDWDVISKDLKIIGHVLDRKENYYELHHQTFIINLEWWNSIGRPFIGEDMNHPDGISLPNIHRSEENHHDDYTPLWITKGNGSSTYHKTKFGWNIISKALENDKKINSFNKKQRASKCFLYPEVKQDFNTAKNKRHVMKQLQQMYFKHFLINTESFCKLDDNDITFDFLVTTSSGLSSLIESWANNVGKYGTILINDISKDSLNFQKQLIDELQNDPETIHKIKDTFNKLVDKDKHKEFAEIRNHITKNQWKVDKIQNHIDKIINDYPNNFLKYVKEIFPTLKIEYKNFDLFDTQTAARNIIQICYDYQCKTSVISISNIFHYYPTCLIYSFRERQALLTDFLDTIQKSMPNTFCKKDGGVPRTINMYHDIFSYNDILKTSHNLSHEEQKKVLDYKWKK